MLSFRRQKDTSDKESISGSSEQSEDSQDDCSRTDSSVDDVRQKQKKMRKNYGTVHTERPYSSCQRTSMGKKSTG